jgi:DDE superfamily endonuclease
VGAQALARGKKNARRRKAWIVFEDESGVSERPAVRRTWAPKGQTPVLIHAFNWGKISVAAALAYRWDGKRSRVYFQTRPGSYGAERLIAFLQQLRHHFRGQRVILVWDGLPAHKSCLMKAYLQSQRPWLREERLPGYAPDLNPVETLWSNIKGQELANRCSANLAEAATAVCQGMARVRRHAQQLAFSFLDHVGLSF